MAVDGKLDDAIARLDEALNRLARAVAIRVEHDLANAGAEEELAIMQDDRARLALDLDAALGRAAALEKTRDEVLRRLDAAGAGIAAALDDAAGSGARSDVGRAS